MSEIIDQFYTPLLIEHGFIRDPDNQQYGACLLYTSIEIVVLFQYIMLIHAARLPPTDK